METYLMIHDSGHGWMEVPTVDVIRSGFVPSKYSYVNPSTWMTYLEEDCDLPGYLKAAGIQAFCIKDTEYFEGDAWVRNLPSSHPDTYSNQLLSPAILLGSMAGYPLTIANEDTNCRGCGNSIERGETYGLGTRDESFKLCLDCLTFFEEEDIVKRAAAAKAEDEFLY